MAWIFPSFGFFSRAPQFVEEQISENKIVVFSNSYCPHSRMAKKALQDIGAEFTTIDLDKRNDGKEVQSFLGTLTGGSTTPRVFVNGKCIGGGTDTKALRYSGRLQKLINGS